MPVILNIKLKLKLSHVLHRQGIQGDSSRQQIIEMTQELLSSVEKHSILEPAVTYNIYQIGEMLPEAVCLEGGWIIGGTLLPSVLHKSREISVVVCTIGNRLEEKVTEYFKNKDALMGSLLDGIGTAAVDTLIIDTCELIRLEALNRGYQASSPVSPGMPGLPLSEQAKLLKLASANEIGVSLTSSRVMVPRKSTSAVIGMGPDMPKWTQPDVCSRCNLREICHYKT